MPVHSDQSADQSAHQSADRAAGPADAATAAEIPAQRPAGELVSEPEGSLPGLDSEPGPGLTGERIDRLLARLAQDERAPVPTAYLGPLATLHGRASGLLLAGVLTVLLLAGGLLALYVLGRLI